LAKDSRPPNGLSTDPANPTPFTLYFQATLLNFLDPDGNEITGTGLNSDYEITILVAYGEAGFLAGNVAVFDFDPNNDTNYVKIYYDDSPDADHVAGTGFNDGVPLMEGVIVEGDQPGQVLTGGNFTADVNTGPTTNIEMLDALNGDNYPGVGSNTGGGITRATADMDESSVNATYIEPNGPQLILLELLSNSSQVTPFIQQDPSALFYDAKAMSNITPQFGNCTGGGIPCEANTFATVNGSTENGPTRDFQSQSDANSSIVAEEFFECDVDIIKEVREIKDILDEWADADLCTDADVPVIEVPGGAMYRLTVENKGTSILTNCTITDGALGVNYDLLVDLAPGQVETFMGDVIPELRDEERCSAAGELLNEATIQCDCADIPGEQVDASDTACVICEQPPTGQCRMTHGTITTNQDGTFSLNEDGTLNTEGGPAIVESNSGSSGNGKKARTSSNGGGGATPQYNWSGQIGAPQANDPSFGEQEFNQHNHPFYGSWAFHAGTNSATNPETKIISVECSDPGWCENARCAPFKQIFWDGVGEFQNIKDNVGWDVECDVVPKRKEKGDNIPGTFHYFRAHAGDFGDGGSTHDQQNNQQNPDTCEWTSGGTDINNTMLIGGPDDNPVVPAPPGKQHSDKGSQDCDECPDYFEIEIHCTMDPNSPIIYEVHDFITNGNIQIHPEVTSSCKDFFP
jgi:hypothetical protein